MTSPASVKAKLRRLAAAERIKEGADYEGVRVKVTGYLDKSRHVLQFDVGYVSRKQELSNVPAQNADSTIVFFHCSPLNIILCRLMHLGRTQLFPGLLTIHLTIGVRISNQVRHESELDGQCTLPPALEPLVVNACKK